MASTNKQFRLVKIKSKFDQNKVKKHFLGQNKNGLSYNKLEGVYAPFNSAMILPHISTYFPFTLLWRTVPLMFLNVFVIN